MAGFSGYHGGRLPPKNVAESGGINNRARDKLGEEGAVADLSGANTDWLSLQTAAARVQAVPHLLRQQQQRWTESSPLYQGPWFASAGLQHHEPLAIGVSQQPKQTGWWDSLALHPSFVAADLQQQHDAALMRSWQQQEKLNELLLLRQQQLSRGLMSGSTSGVNANTFGGVSSGSLPTFQLPAQPSPYFLPTYQGLRGGAMMDTYPRGAAASTLENPTAAMPLLYSVPSSSFAISQQASTPVTARLSDAASILELRCQQILDDMMLSSGAVLQQQILNGSMGSQTQQQYHHSSNHGPATLDRKRSMSSGSSERVAQSATGGEISVANKRAKAVEKPKRPLSAYNIFFRDERQKLLNMTPVKKGEGTLSESDDEDGAKKPHAKSSKNPNKVSFESMAKIIGQRWRDIASDASAKSYYQNLADRDKKRHAAEQEVWKRQESEALTKQRNDLECAVDGRTKELYFEKAGVVQGKQQRKSDGNDESS